MFEMKTIYLVIHEDGSFPEGYRKREDAVKRRRYKGLGYVMREVPMYKSRKEQQAIELQRTEDFLRWNS